MYAVSPYKDAVLRCKFGVPSLIFGVEDRKFGVRDLIFGVEDRKFGGLASIWAVRGK